MVPRVIFPKGLQLQEVRSFKRYIKSEHYLLYILYGCICFIFFSSYCFATSLLKCKFCAYVEEFDAAPQSHLSDIYYSAALFWGARQCGKSLEILLLTSCKIEIVKPQTSQNKSLCIFKAVVSGGRAELFESSRFFEAVTKTVRAPH